MKSGIFSLKNILNNSGVHSITDEELQSLQVALVEMYADIVNVCEPYNIKPFLQGGTLLGKVRHNGFIPWDDDLDLGMMRDDYERFKQIFKEKLGDKYIITGPGCERVNNRFIQIYKKDSYYSTYGMSTKTPPHIYIDIFPIDYVPNNFFHKLLKGIRCNLLMAIAGCVEFREDYNEEIDLMMGSTMQGRINKYLRLIVGKAFSFFSLGKWYKLVDRSLQTSMKTKYCTSGTGRKHYFGEIIPTDAILPLRNTDFYSARAWAPQNADIYLKNLYGDYMRIPKEADREHHMIKKIIIKL